MLTKPFGTMVKFIADGVGAVLRTLFDKAREARTVQDFGAVGDGVTDDSAAFSKAMTAAMLDGFGRVRAPAGTYRISNEVAVTLAGQSGVVLYGDGPDLTVLLVDTASGNALSFTSTSGNWWLNVSPHNAVGLERLTIATTKTNTGTAVAFNMGSLEGRPAPPIVLRDLVVRGHDGFGDCFAQGFDFLDTSGIYAYGVRVFQGGPGTLTGTAYRLRCSGPANDPAGFNFIHCEALFGSVGWQLEDHCEGLYLTQCNVINANRGVVANVVAESGLHVVGGHMNCYERGFDLDGVFDGSVTGMLIYKNGASATFRHFSLDNCGSLCITGNQLRGGGVAGEIAVNVSNSPADTTHGLVIAGNHITNVDLGILLEASTSRVLVGENQFLHCNARVTDSGAGNAVHKRVHSITTVISLVGGAVGENINVAIPAGIFLSKPSAVHINCGTTENIIGVYDFDDVGSTAVQAVCRVRKLDGTNITAGNHRFSFTAFE